MPSHRAGSPGGTIVAEKRIVPRPSAPGPSSSSRPPAPPDRVVMTSVPPAGLARPSVFPSGTARTSPTAGSRGAALGQRQVGLDLVAVAAAVLLLHHITCPGEVGNDAVGAALGDAQAGGDVAQPRARVVGEAHQHPGVGGQETQSATPGKLAQLVSGNTSLALEPGLRPAAGYRGPAPGLRGDADQPAGRPRSRHVTTCSVTAASSCCPPPGTRPAPCRCWCAGQACRR
jgi:hypothetical protein